MGSEPDLSEFEALSNRAVTACKTGTILGRLEDTEREQLKAALATEPSRITNAAIAQWLTNRGHKIVGQSVSRHRRGQCGCGS